MAAVAANQSDLYEPAPPHIKGHNTKSKRGAKLKQDGWNRFRELLLAVSVSAFLDRCLEEKYGIPKPRQ